MSRKPNRAASLSPQNFWVSKGSPFFSPRWRNFNLSLILKCHLLKKEPNLAAKGRAS
jgi:hypothetical protein